MEKPEKITILTLGVGTRSLPELMALLRGFEIRAVIDCRDSARSRAVRDPFSQDKLKVELALDGVLYVYDERLTAAMSTNAFTKRETMPAVERAKRWAKEQAQRGRSLALLGADANPARSHVKRILPWHFAMADIDLIHIDQQGEIIQTEDDDLLPPWIKMKPRTGAQIPLIGEPHAAQHTRRGRPAPARVL